MKNKEFNEVDSFIKRLRKDREKEKNKEKNILHNEEYMDTLVKKLRINSYVFESSDDKESYDTYNDISILYKLIDNYAQDNCLYPLSSVEYNIYYLKYNNYIFSIFRKKNDRKVIYGCYPNFLDENSLPYCIDFNDLKNQNALDINDFTKGLVVELRNTIDKLYNEGFPTYFLQQLVDNMIEDKRKKENENVYKKI